MIIKLIEMISSGVLQNSGERKTSVAMLHSGSQLRYFGATFGMATIRIGTPSAVPFKSSMGEVSPSILLHWCSGEVGIQTSLHCQMRNDLRAIKTQLPFTRSISFHR